MVKIEDTKEGIITYYPFLDKKEDITRYEPHIIRKYKDKKQMVDLRLSLDNLDRDSWKKISDVMKEIFFENTLTLPDPTYSHTWAGTNLPTGGLIFSGGGSNTP